MMLPPELMTQSTRMIVVQLSILDLGGPPSRTSSWLLRVKEVRDREGLGDTVCHGLAATHQWNDGCGCFVFGAVAFSGFVAHVKHIVRFSAEER